MTTSAIPPQIDLAFLNPLIEEVGIQKAIPAISKDANLIKKIEAITRLVPTEHKLVLGDARDLSSIEDESIHLIVTSPPYWSLKKYHESDGQLGNIQDYDAFLFELDKVWAECFRVLVKGGRLIVVVGDVCLSRKEAGRHLVMPLHASIVESCRKTGFDNLSPIIWHKIANATFEVSNGGGGILGKPFEPNAVIKNDIEFILMQRKPGAYRKPDTEKRLLSTISQENHKKWFRQIWTDIPGASTQDHPAPYPVELSTRLIRMFSFVGDTVLDPFAGTGSTIISAAATGRNSIGIEIDPGYLEFAYQRLRKQGIMIETPQSVKRYQRTLTGDQDGDGIMDQNIIDAVRSYRAIRDNQIAKQTEAGKHDQGTRGAATGGAQMDAFADLICSAITEAGIPESEIFQKTAVELPGYYRPEKKWDIVVVHKGVLGAVIELKSQMGPSFGNNFNNRSEEAIGSATDIWVAFREKRFGSQMFRPWLGYLFLLEDCAESTAPVAVREPHFAIDEIFRGASYKKRYEILCERLILERLYESSCFITARFEKKELHVDEPNPNLSFDHFIGSLKGHMQILTNQVK